MQATYRLECLPCQRLNGHTNDFVSERKVIPIAAESHLVDKFRHQDLIFAKCPECRKQYMAWVGIDHCGQPAHQERVSDKKRDYWAKRYIDFGLSLTKDKTAHHMVMGGRRDKQSGHWMPCMVKVK
jgi:hypothetical protein